MTRFLEALAEAPLPLVMEVKPRAADGTDLLRGRRVADLVARYEAAGAPCLSVVTGRWFGGTPDLLRDVVACTDLPVLRKDFLTRREQLVASRDLGASAVLLTAQLLPAVALRTLVLQALDLGLTPFVEVVDETEIASVVAAERCVVAVNNRDVRDGERTGAGPARSLALLDAVRRTGCRVPVSASGIDSPQVARTMLDAGYRGLLVGTALLRHDGSTADLSAWTALARREAVPA